MAEAGWVRVAAKADVAENTAKAIRVGDKEIALYHLPGGEYRATDNICTHEYAQLTDGAIFASRQVIDRDFLVARASPPRPPSPPRAPIRP